MKKIPFVFTFLLFLSVAGKSQDMATCMQNYTYSDMWADNSLNIYASASTQPYCSSGTFYGQPFTHTTGSDVTITSPSGRSASFTGGSNYNGMTLLSFVEGDLGEYNACYNHNSWCSARSGPYAFSSGCDSGTQTNGYSWNWYIKTAVWTDGSGNCDYARQCDGETVKCLSESTIKRQCFNGMWLLRKNHYFKVLGVKLCTVGFMPLDANAENKQGPCQDVNEP